MKAAALTLFAAAVIVAGCAHVPPPVDRVAVAAAVEETLDRWHRAASEADLEVYVGAMDDDGVFMGTDGTERWSTGEFALFVEPYFSKGEGWTYSPSDRHVRISDDGRTAWFDERLANDSYGDLRGTGVVVMTERGWRIAQYNMTFVLPNRATRKVVKLVRRDGRVEPLPRSLAAGTYFTTVTYRSVCDGCRAPRFAVISGVFHDEEACTETMKKLSAVPLQAGFPLVIHTDELAPTPEDLVGIAVVLGLFEDGEAAEEWLKDMGQFVGGAEVIELLDREAAYDRAYAAVEAGEEEELVQTRLVRIQAGRPTPAYTLRDVDEYEQEHGIGPVPDGVIEPLCLIEPGTFFAVKDRTFNHRYYAHAPVRCPDGAEALVSWQSTLLDTAIVPDEQGRAVLSQVVGAECDSPLVETWYYDENGRYRLEGERE